MRRTLALFAALGLLMAACGSGSKSDVAEQGGTTQVKTQEPAASSAEPNDNAIDRAMLGTVQILVLDPDNKAIGACSGTNFHPAGYIVTNWHCVGVTHLYGRTAQAHGSRYHPQGFVAVGPTKDPREAPAPTYIAQLITGSPDADIAVVKIIDTIGRGTELPAKLTLPVVPTGDSDTVKVGERMHVIGYPGGGGDFVTRTAGTIAGFFDLDGDGKPDAFKTDAKAGPGVSGGLWVNDRGQQIGVATFGSSVQAGDTFNGAVFAGIAKPFMDEAVALAGTAVGPPPAGLTLPGTPPSASAVRPTPTPRSTPTPVRTPSPTPVRTSSPTSSPTAAATATARPTATSTGASTATPRATATAAPPGGGRAVGPEIVMSSTLIDADTKRPIAGGGYIVLKEGVTIAQFEAATSRQELALTFAESDGDGVFVLEPIAKGKTYVTISGADGYTIRFGKLEIPRDAPDFVLLNPIELKRR